MIENKFKWYAIYCGSNQEKNTKDNIERELKLSKLDSFIERIEVPTDKTYVNMKNKKIIREKIVLPCYVFIKADILSNGEVLPLLRKVKGVLGFINPSDNKTKRIPEALKDSEVEKFFKNTDINKDLNKDFIMGERVRIIDGAFTTFEGIIDEIYKERKSIKVIVKIFSRETPVELEYSQVEKIIKVI